MNALSVIVPCYNEEQVVQGELERLHQMLASLNIGEFEIIAVNDGSTDRTGEMLRSLTLKRIRVIDLPRNQGYGAALKRGIAESKHPWVLITDADGTYPVEAIPALLSKAGNARMVVGSRTGKTVRFPGSGDQRSGSSPGWPIT